MIHSEEKLVLSIMGVHGLKELLDFLPGVAAGSVAEQGVFLNGVLMAGVAEDVRIFRSPQVGEGPGGVELHQQGLELGGRHAADGLQRGLRNQRKHDDVFRLHVDVLVEHLGIGVGEGGKLQGAQVLSGGLHHEAGHRKIDKAVDAQVVLQSTETIPGIKTELRVREISAHDVGKLGHFRGGLRLEHALARYRVHPALHPRQAILLCQVEQNPAQRVCLDCLIEANGAQHLPLGEGGVLPGIAHDRLCAFRYHLAAHSFSNLRQFVKKIDANL